MTPKLQHRHTKDALNYLLKFEGEFKGQVHI